MSLLALTEPEQSELLTLEDVRQLVPTPSRSADRARHVEATRVAARALDLAFNRLSLQDTPARREMANTLAAFRAQAAPWLERDGLFEALAAEHGSNDPRSWPARDRDLFAGASETAAPGRRQELAVRHAGLLERRAFSQFLLHLQHSVFQQGLRERAMALFGDLQIGLSPRDAWAWRELCPCATSSWARRRKPDHPIGQPWGYPVLSPFLTQSRFSGQSGIAWRPRPALAFVRLRIDEQMLREYDGLRIDHPHGWVCPWVYGRASKARRLRRRASNRVRACSSRRTITAFVRGLPSRVLDQLRSGRCRCFDDRLGARAR